MLASAKRLGVIASFGAALALVATAHGQVNVGGNVTRTVTNTNTLGAGSNLRIGPGIIMNTRNIGSMTGSNPYSPSTSPSYTCYGYCPSGLNYGCYGNGYGYGGYSGGGYGGGYGSCDPYNGYLTGAASVISSQSQFVVAKRQAQLINEQAKQAAVDTQRKIYEEWKYEKNDQPTLEQIRRENWELAYKHAVFHPPANDIWSADALNRILDHAARLQAQGGAGSTVDLDEQTLERINFSTGVAGNIGALKNKGQLKWPAVLRRKDFAEERARFDQLAADAYRTGTGNNAVDSGILEDMERNLTALDDKLTQRVKEFSPGDYIDGKHYLGELAAAIRSLGQADVAKQLNDEYAVKAKNVGELIKKMSGTGVRFARVRSGDEWAYNSLYQALLSYDLGLAEKSGGNR
jgi:hypothetical protein